MLTSGGAVEVRVRVICNSIFWVFCAAPELTEIVCTEELRLLHRNWNLQPVRRTQANKLAACSGVTALQVPTAATSVLHRQARTLLPLVVTLTVRSQEVRYIDRDTEGGQGSQEVGSQDNALYEHCMSAAASTPSQPRDAYTAGN